MNKRKRFISGLAIGLFNIVFGAGGGIIAVTVLRKENIEQKQAQATAIAIILPLTIISTAVYLCKGYFTLNEAIPFIPFGFAGSIAGTKLLPKAKNEILKITFSCLMIWAGIRLITG